MSGSVVLVSLTGEKEATPCERNAMVEYYQWNRESAPHIGAMRNDKEGPTDKQLAWILRFSKQFPQLSFGFYFFYDGMERCEYYAVNDGKIVDTDGVQVENEGRFSYLLIPQVWNEEEEDITLVFAE